VPERAETIRIGRHDVKVTRPDKVLFPEDGITKRDMVEYYRRISPWILPHLKSRPLSLERFPDGIDQTRIIQKSVSRYYPEWIKTATVKKVGGSVRHVVCEDEATLAYLGNQAAITPHIWLSRTDKLDFPDQMVFDLDPSGEDFAPVKATAESLRRLLSRAGLAAFAKTSGSRGLHVVVPLKRDSDFDSVRAFARRIAKIAVEEDPGNRTIEVHKAKRGGRVYVDTNRNAYAQKDQESAPLALPKRPTRHRSPGGSRNGDGWLGAFEHEGALTARTPSPSCWFRRFAEVSLRAIGFKLHSDPQSVNVASAMRRRVAKSPSRDQACSELR
jgi:bifunctional non-homologous end joining protein LigD